MGPQYAPLSQDDVVEDTKSNDTGAGYRWVKHPGHPSANNRGWVREHRIRAEEELGRPLKKDEIVHHRDEDRGNNARNNREVMTRGEHTRMHRSGEKSLLFWRKLLTPRLRRTTLSG